MKKERILYLDVIRIVGFFVVTAYHFTMQVAGNGIEAAYIDLYVGFNSFRWASIAVFCFFMVSGAALIYQYEDKLQLKEYYKKRFLGTFPLFWLAYLFAFLERFYHEKSMPEAPKATFILSIIGMDGYLKEYGDNFYLIGEWFLGAIIILYILFPLYRSIMCKNIYILPLVFLGAGMWVFFYNPFQIIPEKNPIVYSMYFVLGMLLEMLRKRSGQKAALLGRRIAGAVGAGVYVLVYMIERVHHFINPYCRTFILAMAFYLAAMEFSTWIKSERAQRMIAAIGRHSFAYFLIHHVFLKRYVARFSGLVMNGSNTLFLFLSSVGYIYLLAVGLDKVYAYFMGAFRRERLVTKSK